MPLELHPVRPEDLESLFRLMFSAFNEGTVANRAMHPNGITDDLVKFTAEQTKTRLSEHAVFYFSVIDTDTNELIGYCVWKREDEAQEANRQAIREQTQTSMPPDCNHDAQKYFFDGIHGLREHAMAGRLPYWHLCTLTTKPGHERRGAAKLGLDWGLAEADKEGLEAYLDATPVGKPLYARNGFEEVKKVTFDFGPYGLDASEDYCAMIRQPRANT